MRRYDLRWGLALAFCLVWPTFGADAQQLEKMPRVGWLGGGYSTDPIYDGFRQGLQDLGYVEGKNLRIEGRWAEGHLDRLPALAAELVRLKVDVLYVGGDQGLRAAKDATATIPIVALVCDTLEKFVASLARPGGKATGLTCISSALAGKRLQMLKELVPTLARVAVLYNPEDANKAAEYRHMQEAAGALTLTLRAFEARTASQFAPAFAGMAEDHAQALVILTDSLTATRQKELADLSIKYRLPAIFGFRSFADAGGLVSYGAKLRELQRRAATYVDKILKGAAPGDLPVEEPTKFELVINLKTAKALGIAVPQTLFALSDDLIE